MSYTPTNNYYGIPITIRKNTAYYNNPFFYVMLPKSIRDYYIRIVRSSFEWYDGYVYGFHDAEQCYVSTQLCKSILGGVAKSVCGSKLLFTTKSGKQDSNSLKFIANEWSVRSKLHKNFLSTIENSFCGAKSCIKLNQDINGDLWTEAVRQDCFYYKTDFKGECIDAKFFLRQLTNTMDENQFYIFEHRFFTRYDETKFVKKRLGKNEDEKVIAYKKGQLVPVVVYRVYSYKGTGLVNAMVNANGDSDALCSLYNRSSKKCFLGYEGKEYDGYDWEQLPENIKEEIKKDYGNIRIGEMKILPFHNCRNKLGVYLFSNGKDNSMTSADVGKSLVNMLSTEFMTYDIEWSYLLRDMYLGKGVALIPKQFNAPTFTTDKDGNQIEMPTTNLSGTMDRATYEMYDSANPDTDKPLVIQNEMRISEHAQNCDQIYKRLASKLGCSPKRIASWIQGSQSATASEINADDDLDCSFVEDLRANYEDTINELLEDVCIYYEKTDYDQETNTSSLDIVKLKWYSPTALNKDRIQRRLVEQYNLGIISLEFLIRSLYPDCDDTQIKKMVEDARERQEEIKKDKQLFLDAQGNYGNDNEPKFDDTLDQPDLQTPNGATHQE